MVQLGACYNIPQSQPPYLHINPVSSRGERWGRNLQKWVISTSHTYRSPCVSASVLYTYCTWSPTWFEARISLRGILMIDGLWVEWHDLSTSSLGSLLTSSFAVFSYVKLILPFTPDKLVEGIKLYSEHNNSVA